MGVLVGVSATQQHHGREDHQKGEASVYRHFTGRLVGLKGVKAMARYLACLVYRLLTKGPAWVDRGAAYYENKRRDRELAGLHRKAAAAGMKLVPIT